VPLERDSVEDLCDFASGSGDHNLQLAQELNVPMEIILGLLVLVATLPEALTANDVGLVVQPLLGEEVLLDCPDES
jgi:hypothetical protein